MPRKGAPPKSGPRPQKEGQAAQYRIGGVDLPYDPDLDIEGKKPTPLFPEYQPPQPAPPSAAELTSIKHYRAIRSAIHKGPYYTILGDNVRVTRPGERPRTSKATFNAFEGMERYSQRYYEQPRMFPKLNTQPFVISSFPEELRDTVDNLYKSTTSSSKAGKQRAKGLEKMEDAEADGEGEEGDEKGRDPEDEDPLMGEEMDDEYEDDEDGGDYNAEQYFDDGGDDGGEDYDGGGDDGGGYMD